MSCADNQSDSGAVTGLAVLAALLGFALIIAGGVIIVLVLCVRELQREGGQKRGMQLNTLLQNHAVSYTNYKYT